MTICRFESLLVDAIHVCQEGVFRGCIHLSKQKCWAYSGKNILSDILLPHIKYCPYCGEELEETGEAFDGRKR